ncbi:MAG: hypothetical protein IJ736_09410, partial [Firmicutes bacterium]|nr:hypothetical protein [Bacillota bacterium]
FVSKMAAAVKQESRTSNSGSTQNRRDDPVNKAEEEDDDKPIDIRPVRPARDDKIDIPGFLNRPRK